jgi:hypothetical protein
VVLGLSGLLAGVLCGFTRAFLSGARVLAASCEVQQAVRIGLHLIERDVRGARYSPGGPLTGGVRRARRDAVEVAMDTNGDGDANDPGEIVGYALQAATQTLVRTMGNAPPQPMLNGIAEDGLVFRYFDADGLPLDPGTTELDAAERERIRRVDIGLTVEDHAPDPVAPHQIRAAATTTVSLRNAP